MREESKIKRRKICSCVFKKRIIRGRCWEIKKWKKILYEANGREYKVKSRIMKKSLKWRRWRGVKGKRSHSQYWSRLLSQITSKHTNNTSTARIAQALAQTGANNKQTFQCTIEQHEHTTIYTSTLHKLLASAFLPKMATQMHVAQWIA